MEKEIPSEPKNMLWHIYRNISDPKGPVASSVSGNVKPYRLLWQFIDDFITMGSRCTARCSVTALVTISAIRGGRRSAGAYSKYALKVILKRMRRDANAPYKRLN